MTDAEPATAAQPVELTSFRHRSVLHAQGVRVACKVVAFVALGRLVPPDEHGRFAMAASITFFLQLFRDAGLGTASVQAKTLDSTQLSALFGAHVFVGGVLGAITVGLAAPAAWFYAEPALIPLLVTLSAGFVFGGLGGFPRAQLTRTLQFEALSRMESVAAVFATIAMIVAALLGAGAYSFAIFMLTSEAAASALAWRAYGRRQSLSADLSSLRRLLQMGAHVTGYQFVNQLLGSLDTFLVGQVLGSRSLGLYNRPLQLLAMGSQHIAWPLMHVMFATLSRLTGEPIRFVQHVRQTTIVTLHLSLPLATICFVLPEETVRLTLGRDWMESAAILRWLALGAATQTVLILAFGINVAAGQAGRLLASGLASLPLVGLALYGGLHQGILGVAVALTTVNVVLLAPRLWWMLRGTPVGLSVMFSALVGPFLANLAFGIGLVGGRYLTLDYSWPLRLVAGLAGGFIVVGVLYIGWPRLRRELQELVSHLPWRRTDIV